MRIQDLDIDAIQRRNREALSFATEQVGGSEYAPETVLEHFSDDVPALLDALGRAFAVIRQNAITQVNHERKLADASRIVEAARAWRRDVDPRYGEASAEALCKAVDELERMQPAVRPGTCPTCGHPHDHVHVCAVCGEAEMDDGKPFVCPVHDQGSVTSRPKVSTSDRVPSRVQARDEPCADPANCDVHRATTAPNSSEAPGA